MEEEGDGRGDVREQKSSNVILLCKLPSFSKGNPPIIPATRNPPPGPDLCEVSREENPTVGVHYTTHAPHSFTHSPRGCVNFRLKIPAPAEPKAFGTMDSHSILVVLGSLFLTVMTKKGGWTKRVGKGGASPFSCGCTVMMRRLPFFPKSCMERMRCIIAWDEWWWGYSD